MPTSLQQPDRWMLADRRLYIRQGNFPEEVLTGSQTLKAQGNLTGSQLIETHHQTEERIMMKPSTDDRSTGEFHEVEGAIKQNAGKLTKNANLEADGGAEKNAGKVQKTVGKIEKTVGA
jgi:uncharacterized protein YjbJ (UPF0337 family)